MQDIDASRPLLVWLTPAEAALGWQAAVAPQLRRWPAEARFEQPFEAPEAAALMQDWEKPWRRAALLRDLQAFLAQQLSLPAAGGRSAILLASVATGTEAFHQGLMQAAAAQGYQQVLLGWQQAAQRLAALARQRDFLNTARPDAQAQLLHLLRQDQRQGLRLARVLAGLRLAGHVHRWLALDDGAAALRPLGSLEGGLGALLRQEGEWRTGLAQPPAMLRPVLQTMAQENGPVRLVQCAELPALLHEGDECLLGGVVVTDGFGPQWRLVLRQGPRWARLDWRHATPGLAAKYPDASGAGEARFKPVKVAARVRQPARLILRTDGGPPPVPVAELSFAPLGPEQVLGIYLARWGLGYQPIPKVACTSIKEALFALAIGKRFGPGVDAGAAHVHRYFDIRAQDISQAERRLLVVRDPIKRFISGFGNRVLHHRELSREFLSRQGIPGLDLADFPFDPDINQFVANFELYRKVPTIEHHFAPISEYVAPLSAFHKVYAFENLSGFCADVAEHTGLPFQLPHTQRGGPKLPPSVLSPASLESLRRLYAADYQMLKGIYEPPAAA